MNLIDEQMTIPLVAGRSNGGDFDDTSLWAGVIISQLDQALLAVHRAGGHEVTLRVTTSLRRQIELLAMDRGLFETAVRVADPANPHDLLITYTANDGDFDILTAATKTDQHVQQTARVIECPVCLRSTRHEVEVRVDGELLTTLVGCRPCRSGIYARSGE